jgi:NAD(P)-dependent dehydrogenase (short-subunit alcohol dehydrogenase family)
MMTSPSRSIAITFLKITPLGEPGDVAELVAFLATEEAKWIHGAILDVDGRQSKGV